MHLLRFSTCTVSERSIVYAPGQGNTGGHGMAQNSTQTSAPVPHRWRFFRSGGFDQVRLETGADLLALDQLDQKLWAALSCPARGLEFDTKTLALIDSAGDGRIRVPEILAAVQWAGAVLKHPDDLTKGASSLPLSAINDATPAGAQLLASARQILTNLGKGDAEEITLDDTTDTEKIFAKTTFNGDGIIPAAAREKEVETRTGAGISEVAQRAEAGKTPAEQTFDIAKFAGIFAAIGLAIGAIGTALAAVVSGVFGLTWWQIPLALVGLLLVISGPAMVIAYLKLRQRNLAPLLDANGWAVNTRAQINIPFGASLTSLAQLPPGAQRSLQDPFAEKKRPWKLYLLLVVFIAAVAFLWHQGFLHQWWERFASHEAATVTEEPAPATPEEPTPPPDSAGQ
jgi:hypothetical protein